MTTTVQNQYQLLMEKTHLFKVFFQIRQNEIWKILRFFALSRYAQAILGY